MAVAEVLNRARPIAAQESVSDMTSPNTEPSATEAPDLRDADTSFLTEGPPSAREPDFRNARISVHGVCAYYVRSGGSIAP